MRKNTESMMKGAALGLLAGGAVGAAGAKRPVQPPSRIRQLNTDGDGFRSTGRSQSTGARVSAKPTSASGAPASTVAVT